MNSHGNSIGDAVVHADEFQFKSARADAVARFDRIQVGGRNAGFFQASFQDTQGQGRAVDRHVQLFQDIRQGADMVFVAVGQENPPQLILVFYQIGDVGNHQIDAKHVIFREHKARVEQNHVIPITEHGHVLSDFTKTAQRNDIYFFLCFFQNYTSRFNFSERILSVLNR